MLQVVDKAGFEMDSLALADIRTVAYNFAVVSTQSTGQKQLLTGKMTYYPPSQGYPPTTTGNTSGVAPPLLSGGFSSGMAPPQNYPPQTGYPPQNYPPQTGYPPQAGYPPTQGYPPMQNYPPQTGYPPMQQYPPQTGYPPQNYMPQSGYPPTQGYPSQNRPYQQPVTYTGSASTGHKASNGSITPSNAQHNKKHTKGRLLQGVAGIGSSLVGDIFK
eukprot:TRINITY_DN10909_c0_g2_i1.p1 TRINITY_DN10909_c0_g2~~TRINITY_DN10909_c0_g2_i1.p1  ORF type:complete len:216 (-),score=27.30 TRINITY_DN10909_c0_g2_i1:52-699(-)